MPKSSPADEALPQPVARRRSVVGDRRLASSGSSRLGVGADRDGDREEQEREATTWARNHVEPSIAAYQATVPKPKKSVPRAAAS